MVNGIIVFVRGSDQSLEIGEVERVGKVAACAFNDDRLELTGMSWTAQEAESVMRLRAPHINRDWEDLEIPKEIRMPTPLRIGRRKLARNQGSRDPTSRMTHHRK